MNTFVGHAATRLDAGSRGDRPDAAARLHAARAGSGARPLRRSRPTFGPASRPAAELPLYRIAVPGGAGPRDENVEDPPGSPVAPTGRWRGTE